MRTFFQRLARDFQSCCLFAGDRRKGIKKLFQAVTSFKTIDKILNGNTGADKHRDASENIGIAVDDFSLFCHWSLQSVNYSALLTYSRYAERLNDEPRRASAASEGTLSGSAAKGVGSIV